MKKYFICSDLHGVNPKVLKSSLNKKGFEVNNQNHILVVLGDITDGLRNESILLEYLRSFEADNRLIAIKGNHDIGDGYYMPMNSVAMLLDEEYKGIDELPYFVEHEDMNLAHGIFLPKEVRDQLFDPVISSVGGSPCLLNEGNGYRISKQDKHFIKEWAGGVEAYVDKLEKVTFVGHFTKEDVFKTLNKTKLLEKSSQGFYHIKNKLFFVDGGVLRNQNHVAIMTFPFEE